MYQTDNLVILIYLRLMVYCLRILTALSSAEVQWSVRAEPLSRVSAGANNEIVVMRENLCQISVVFLYILVVFLWMERFLYLTKVWDKENAIRGFKIELPNCRVFFSGHRVDFEGTRDQRKVYCMRCKHPPYLQWNFGCNQKLRRVKWTARRILRTIR